MTEASDLYDDAVKFARAEGKCHFSMLQRRFRIGYGSACKLMDMLIANDVIDEDHKVKSPGAEAPEPSTHEPPNQVG